VWALNLQKLLYGLVAISGRKNIRLKTLPIHFMKSFLKTGLGGEMIY